MCSWQVMLNAEASVPGLCVQIGLGSELWDEVPFLMQITSRSACWRINWPLTATEVQALRRSWLLGRKQQEGKDTSQHPHQPHMHFFFDRRLSSLSASHVLDIDRVLVFMKCLILRITGKQLKQENSSVMASCVCLITGDSVILVSHFQTLSLFLRLWHRNSDQSFHLQHSQSYGECSSVYYM